jgi:two-component system, chemotaxis family, CheB/CheR fusion protein
MISSVRSPAMQHVVAILIVGAAAVLTTGVLWHQTGNMLLAFLLALPVGLLIWILNWRKTRAEQALHERDARLQLVSEQIPGGLWSTDRDLHVTSGFGAQSHLLHGPAGTTLFDHFNTTDPAFPAIAAHRRALRGESSSYELQWGGRTFQSYVEPLRGVNRQIIGVVGVATDITDRKYAEEERERLVAALETQHARLNAIVESIPAGIVVAEAPGGRVALVNSHVAEVLRHPVTDVPDVHDYAHWHAHHPDGRRFTAEEYPLARGLRGETVRNAEFIYHRGDDTRGWIRVSGAPILDSQGKIVGSVAIFYDIDQIKRAEEESQQAKQMLEAANHAKDRFLAMLSHELRTPLTPVLALASSLEDRTDLPAGVHEDIETIRRNVVLEATLIDDLLDITRIARGKLQFNLEEVDAHESLYNAVEICRPDAQASQVTLELHVNAGRHFVRVDAARLQQVFWNLIKNAIKFTPAGGTVGVESADAGSDLLRVEVRDTGIGITPDLLPRIFDAFEQGDPSVTRQFGGLGLGLAISKALVEGHGGTISVQSEGEGRGACFTVELHTIAPAAKGSAAPDVASAAVATSLNILVVEDHADTARVMQKLLSACGHQVATATSLTAAMRWLEMGEPLDLVISDLGLPDGSGLDLMREVCRLRQAKGIALSGFGTEEDVQRSIAAGFAAHLTKPVPMSALHEAIARVTAAAKPATEFSEHGHGRT